MADDDDIVGARLLEAVRQCNRMAPGEKPPACAWVGVGFIAQLRGCSEDEAQAWLVANASLVEIGSGWVWQIDAPAIDRLGPPRA